MSLDVWANLFREGHQSHNFAYVAMRALASDASSLDSISLTVCSGGFRLAERLVNENVLPIHKLGK